MTAARLLDAYRRTGADLPFADPRRAHGVPFEGYYWRFTDAPAGRVVVVLCGACRAADGPWAVVAMAAHPGGLVRSAVVPWARVERDRLGVVAGDALVATADRLRVDLGPDARLDAALREPRPWPRAAFGALGPAHALPGLPQYWHPHLLGGRVEGEARLGDETMGLGDTTVYAEKNWGPAFSEHWWWGQAQGFEGADACVAFAGGRITLAGVRAAPTALVLRLERRVLRWAPPLSLMTAAVGEGTGDGERRWRWRVRARSARWSVEVCGDDQGRAAAVLPVPVPAERRVEDRSRQHLAGRLRIEVRRGRRIWFAGESVLAGLEHGTPMPAAPPAAQRS